MPLFGVADSVVNLILDKLPFISFPGIEVVKWKCHKNLISVLKNSTFKEIKHLFYRESNFKELKTALFPDYNEYKKIYDKNSYTIEDHMLDLLHILDNFKYEDDKRTWASDKVKYCFRIEKKETQDYYLLEGNIS